MTGQKQYIITETMIKRIMMRVWEDQEPDPDEAESFEKELRSCPAETEREKVPDVCDCCDEDPAGCDGDYQVCQREHEKVVAELRKQGE